MEWWEEGILISVGAGLSFLSNRKWFVGLYGSGPPLAKMRTVHRAIHMPFTGFQHTAACLDLLAGGSAALEAES